jgi:hypothetical protein
VTKKNHVFSNFIGHKSAGESASSIVADKNDVTGFNSSLGGVIRMNPYRLPITDVMRGRVRCPV